VTDSAVSWLDGKKSAASESAGSRSDFIDDDAITSWLERPAPFDRTRFDELIAKAGRCEGLSGEETAWLVNLKVEDAWQEVFRTAAKVKQAIYGNRIVLFAPLYLSNACVNDCAYCGFRVSNRAIERRTLSHDEVAAEVRSLTREGHKRLLLVAGEHAASDVGYLTSVIERIYAEKNGPDGIRRVNVNIAPLSVADYKRVRESKIGTLQVFQETYHKATYRKLHPAGTIKSDYHWRLFSQHRAQEAGISDVAIGALFGLYDWRFETVALVLHAADMDREFGVGSHTISFPRLEPAINTPFNDRSPWKVSDEDFRKIIAVLRLAVPYTGLILTARERPEFRRELLRLGVSQTDAGTRIAIGGYSEQKDGLSPEREQFRIADTRSLDEFIAELVEDGYIPSFCTADYRCGRVGCDFMQITKAGNIRKLCIPNAVLTFKEYLLDYASAGTREKGDRLIGSYLEQLKRDYSEKSWKDTKDYLARIDSGVRDLYF
jgi:2-iminoacetate synthase